MFTILIKSTFTQYPKSHSKFCKNDPLAWVLHKIMLPLVEKEAKIYYIYVSSTKKSVIKNPPCTKSALGWQLG